MHMPVRDMPAELVVRIVDDNLVLAHEALGQTLGQFRDGSLSLELSLEGLFQTPAANDNRRPPVRARRWKP